MLATHLIRRLEMALAEVDAGPLLLAISGGMDSSVLLHALASLADVRQRGLRAIHVHHGLHPDADAWATQVERVCEELAVALTIVRVDVPRNNGHGIEAAARHARHAAFEQTLAAGEILTLAHHREDQAETFLLRALRASGPDGLGAMRGFRAFATGWLWRPLLETPRSELVDYAHAHSLSWIEDSSNDDASFDRNFLRQQVLPLMRTRWPRLDDAFARSAGLSARASVLLNDDDDADLARVRDADPQILHVPVLKQLDATRRARVLRRWIGDLGLPPLPAQGVAHIERDLLGGDTDREPSFAWAGAIVRRWRALLHADRQRAPWPDDWRTQWDGRAPLPLPDGSWLRLQGADAFEAPMQVTGRRGGERMTLPGRTHSHTLKHLLQEAAIPAWRRGVLPLLFDADGILLAAGDRLVSGELAQWLDARGARLRHDTGPD
jgi:tRNA(Ile)-lysidine synthase